MSWAALLLGGAGALLVLVGLLDERDSLGRIGIGAGLLLAGVFADRLRRAKVGPTGAEIELDRRATDSLVELRTVSPAATQAPTFPAPEQVIDVHRAALGYEVIAFLTTPDEGPLSGCRFQLYLFDADQKMLLPILEPGHGEPSPRFRVGEGAVGRAWASGEFTLVEGTAVSDATFGLSPEKQARYGDLAAVAAMPLTNAGGRVIAVLSASTTAVRSGLTTEEGFDALLAMAAAIARVLVDLLKWFADDYDDQY